MKKTILFMPSWYPTKENPISGSFFREQAIVLAENFNIVVLHYQTFKYGFKGIFQYMFKRKCIISVNNSDAPLQEIYFSNYIFFKHGFIGKILNNIIIYNWINNLKLNKNILRLKKIILNEFKLTPDLLYSVTAQINAVQASKLAKAFNIPYVVSEHCPFPLPQTAISNETKNAIENADCVLSISRDKTRQMLIQGLKIEPELVGNMIDEDVFILPKENEKSDIFTILIVAANNFYKDYPTFLKTIKQLKTICSNSFKVLIVGFNPVDGKSIWNQGEQEFIKLVDSFGLLEMCELIPRATRQEMPLYYHKSDVFVMTSIQEGFPVSSLEATACGLPVYATRCGGVEDFIDNDNGRIVNILDYEELAKELKKLVDGEVFYNNALIREKTIKRYGKQAFKNRLTNIFNRVIDTHNEEYNKNN